MKRRLDDGTAKLALTWFNAAYLRRAIHPGDLLRVRGKVRIFRNIPQMTPAEVGTHRGRCRADPARDVFAPIYPASMKLSSDAIGRVVRDNLDAALASVEEWFEPRLLEKNASSSAGEMRIGLIHCPANMDDAAPARAGGLSTTS